MSILADQGNPPRASIHDAIQGHTTRPAARPIPPPTPKLPPAGDPAPGVRWRPHRRSALARILESPVRLVSCLLLIAAIVSVGIWIARPHHATVSAPTKESARPSARFEQITAAVRAPLLTPAPAEDAIGIEKAALRPPMIIGDAQDITVVAGGNAKVAAHIENEAGLEPETVLLVGGLPSEAELSDGIKINSGLWMLRPNLLERIEIRTGASPAGRHELTLELRRPEGSIVASTRVALDITPVEVPVAVTRTAPATAAKESPAVTGTALERLPAPAKPARKAAATRKERIAAPEVAPIEVPRPKAKQATPKTTLSKADPGPKAETKSATTPRVMSGGPIGIPQSQQGPRLVWPGDDPRAVYSQTPPVFLGGAAPGAQQPDNSQRPLGDPAWRSRAFGQ